MAFPTEVKEEALVKSGRHCCICHKFCGLKIELHHIIQTSEKGDNSLENCIPLCFDCHADMRSYDHKHPKGTKYTPNELRRHRTSWYEKIENNLGTGGGSNIKADSGVFKRIFDILPPIGTIAFIRKNNFAGFSFERPKLDDFHRLLNLLDNEPWMEFFDSDLESLKLELVNNIKIFQALIATQTYSVQGKNRASIPSEWEETNPEGFDKAVSSIHNSTEIIVKIYDSLIKLARKKLDIDIYNT